MVWKPENPIPAYTNYRHILCADCLPWHSDCFQNPLQFLLYLGERNLRPIFFRFEYAIKLFFEVLPYFDNVMNPLRNDLYLGSTGYLYITFAHLSAQRKKG